MSGLWGVLVAPSKSSIQLKYPELAVVESLPSWMDDPEVDRMREAPRWLDDDPLQGLLRAVIAGRKRE